MAQAPFQKAYLVNLFDQTRVEFDFNPDNITDTKGAELEEEQIPGASHPRVTWTSGSGRPINFTVRLVRLVEEQPVDHVLRQVEWLHSVVAPIDTGEMDTHRAPIVKFIMGKLYDIPVYVRNVQVRWGNLRAEDMLPEWADVTLVLEEISYRTVFSNLIIGGSSFSRSV